ncbi:MAG: trehalose-phosphatase [Litorimonas sp.]
MSLPPPPILSERHALFLDFDGTLAPLQDERDQVFITAEQMGILLKLSDMRSGAMAILSGRDIRDLASRIPDGLMRVGNHGLYRMAPGETRAPVLEILPGPLEVALRRIVASRQGSALEVKGPVGTIHYRTCPELGPMLIDAVETAVATHPDYRCKVGNHVVEAVPTDANKGTALDAIMQTDPFAHRIPVMVGDDTTDEDGFVAAQRLGGFGVKVGEVDTVARKRLAGVDAVWSWLRQSL